MTRPDHAAAERAWMLLQRFADTHSRHAAMADALGFSLGGGRGRVLSAVAEGPLALGDLATQIGFDAPYTSRVVDEVVTRGLVERRAHPDDGRRKLVALTPAGVDALATAEHVRRTAPEPLHRLDGADLRLLGDLLARLNAADAT